MVFRPLRPVIRSRRLRERMYQHADRRTFIASLQDLRGIRDGRIEHSAVGISYHQIDRPYDTSYLGHWSRPSGLPYTSRKTSATRQVIAPFASLQSCSPEAPPNRTHVLTRPAESDNRRPTSTLSTGAEDERTRGRARWNGLGGPEARGTPRCSLFHQNGIVFEASNPRAEH